MIYLKDIQKRVEKEKIKFYKVGLTPDVITTGNDFFNMDNFIEFLHSQKVSAVFGCECFDNVNDYLITEDIIEETLGKYFAEEMQDVIFDDIKKYNEEISEIDFSIPFAFIVACLYEGQYFFVRIKNDRNFDENSLIDPEEKLQEIVVNNQNNIYKKREAGKEITQRLKRELKEKIANDEEFLLCTNKQLRFNYIRNLVTNKLDEHFAPLKRLWISDAPRGIYQDPVDLVELIWREINQK